jgi:hypothetical protein
LGFLSWLFQRKSQVERLPDRIWMTGDGRLAGLVADVRQRLTQDALVVVAAHFPAAVRAAWGRLAAEGLAPGEFVRSADPRRLLQEVRGGSQPRLLVGLAEDVAATTAMPGHQPDPSQCASVLLSERHPCHSCDESVAAALDTWPCHCRLGFYVALDDAFMKLFAGDWVRQVLAQLGMKEGEAIESPLISRRIIAAQKKLEQSVVTRAPADSAEEWILKNALAK